MVHSVYRVNTSCHLPITFTLTAKGCIVSQVQAWLPVAVDNQRKAAQERSNVGFGAQKIGIISNVLMEACVFFSRGPLLQQPFSFWGEFCILCRKCCILRSIWIKVNSSYSLMLKGYRVVSLSSRSLEEMWIRCMVRVMFNRWLLPHTHPSESARQNAHN